MEKLEDNPSNYQDEKNEDEDEKMDKISESAQVKSIIKSFKGALSWLCSPIIILGR